MNWEAIGTIAETVSAAAVVISLIYLAAQIRQSNRQVEEQLRALRLQAYDTAGADFSALRLHVSGDPQRASVWRRAKDSYSELQPDERAQANEMLHELMWAYQNIFSRMHGGAEDDVLRKLVDDNLGHWMDNPGFREWWQTENKTPYTDEFETLMQGVCSRFENADR
ncbi:MAG: hypothetical protein AAGE01_04775 [Pseudomonadota bacterium]